MLIVANATRTEQPTRCAFCGDVGHLQSMCPEYLVHQLEEAEPV